ncbi:ABC transporter permease [Frankia sp. AgB32]|uniref:ABC transporter permease n=1 Tax=Frankia sp. AgB32 TaxID=631119 RepID=UPI00200FBCA7|nr:ABC transporter permease [Frankia sp. AgB32]MCK9894358.1 ABC transporter permease [Frankia sp. AgB32]
MSGQQAGVATLARTELFKIASSRRQAVALLAVLVLHVPPMLWGGQDADASWNGLRSRSGLFVAYAVMALGILIVAQEYRYSTAALAFLAVPGRRPVTVAQSLVVAAVGLTISSVLFAAWLTVGVLRYGAAGMHLDRPGQVVAAWAVVVVTVCSAGVLGVGVGTILRGSTAALLALGCCGALEPLLDVTRFRGPVTAPLGVLAWPTSELEMPSLVSAVCWGALALLGALLGVGRDVPS